MFSFLWLNLCFGSTFPPTKSRQRTLGKDHRVLFCFNFMERVQEFGLFRKGARAWKSCILSLLSTSLKIRGLCSLSFSSQPFASLSLPPSFSSFLLPLSLKISFSLPTWIWLDITTQRLPLFPIINSQGKILDWDGQAHFGLEVKRMNQTIRSEVKWIRSVVSDSLWPHELSPTRLLSPWNFSGKSTGVGCHFLLQGIFLTQGSNWGLPDCGQMLYYLSHQGSSEPSTNSVTYLRKKTRVADFS